RAELHPGAAGCRMQPRDCERSTGLDLAGDVGVVERALGFERDVSGLGVALVAVLERRLHGAQRGGVHSDTPRTRTVIRAIAYSEAPASPPEAAVVRPALAGIGDGGTLERAVERGEHAPLDEVKGRRLAVARARQIAADLLVDAARPRAHHHDAVGKHHRLL